MPDIRDTEFFLLDMDGTLYLGDELIPGAAALLEKIKATGRRYAFMTNNSSKNAREYVIKLKRLGIAAAENEVFTSGEAASGYLRAQNPDARIFLLGTGALGCELLGAGLSVVNDTQEKPDFVLLGFDTTLTYEKIWRACDYIRAGVPFVATHPDLNCPIKGGKMPDTGSMIKLFEAATGVSPLVVGKPSHRIIDEAAAKYGFTRERTVMVGDRLSTDIAVGKNAGIGAVLVFSGETSRGDYEAQDEFRADFCFPSVLELAAAL